ncbi:tol-pal system protein YbgF [Thiomicrorhabdus xiamenensis]|uniref:Cell division coordinator CpoB n=1 Tax=Thiomicrorhabdus xiamenensis TaxID=2739063 RepID=A0A7D4SJ04_9GAMM|nr:tol-pal system protein YbgF [Thiomicrorhabdus xiamenensis]QKI89399.1 tol-pal system protein YbgF [Thiomicrorhabdus xiamenensis]
MNPKNVSVKKAWLAASLSLLFVASTAQAQSIEQRLERLERMASNPVMLEMTRKINDQEREIQGLQDQLDRIQRDMPQSAAVSAHTSTPQNAELQKTLADLQTRLNEMNDKLTVQGARIIVLEDELRALKAVPAQPQTTQTQGQPKVQTPPAATETAQPVQNEEAAEPASVLPIKTRPATTAEKKAYQDAFGLMRSSDYDGSIKAFSGFIENSAESDLAANAYYWMGEGYFIKGQFAKAYEAFQAVYLRYPDSVKTSDSMLRSADALEKLERLDEAKQVYQEVVNLFPESRAANNAQKRLEKM